MATMLCVIAGNNDEYNQYTRKKLEESEYSATLNVYSADALVGISNPTGVFIGTWSNRPDLYEVLEMLVNIKTRTNPDWELPEPAKGLLELRNNFVESIQNATKNTLELEDEFIDKLGKTWLMNYPADHIKLNAIMGKQDES
jgi:hypothetical protein